MNKHKRKDRAKPRPSTALVRVAQRLDLAARRLKTPDVLPPAAIAGLTEDIVVGAFGKLEVKFTPAEELILSEEVKADQIQIKPSGQPYLSHPGYTRWFNRAFGRGGWSLVPIAKPMKTESGVACPYLLYIHGQPAAFAMGEGDYHGNNREQTWGDALEATVASALRRCAKRLGVGLELWDRRWLNTFIDKHCILVKRDGRKGVERAWRRVDDPPFFDEEEKAADRKGETAMPAQRQAQPPRAAGHHKPGAVITADQVKRLWTIIRHTGRSEDEIKKWLLARYKLDSTKLITQDIYDQIVAAVEARGELPPSAEMLAEEARATRK